MIRHLWTLAVFALLSVGLCGDTAAAVPVGAGDSAAGAAVSALTTPSSTARSLGGRATLPMPADFTAVMGYRPVRVAGRWVAPDGACSAPTGATRYDFALACRAHDLGYDLLRYAARVGQPLGPWAREAVDEAFGRALDARCAELRSTVGCRVAAALYHGTVVANSWRQDSREPRQEPALPWILLATALTLAPVLINAAVASRSRFAAC